MIKKIKVDCSHKEIPMKIFKHGGKNICVGCYKIKTAIKGGYSYE